MDPQPPRHPDQRRGQDLAGCALVRKGCRGGYSPVPGSARMLRDLMAAKDQGRHPKQPARFAKVEVMAIDDWDPARLREENRRDLLDVLDDRRHPGPADPQRLQDRPERTINAGTDPAFDKRRNRSNNTVPASLRSKSGRLGAKRVDGSGCIPRRPSDPAFRPLTGDVEIMNVPPFTHRNAPGALLPFQTALPEPSASPFLHLRHGRRVRRREDLRAGGGSTKCLDPAQDGRMWAGHPRRSRAATSARHPLRQASPDADRGTRSP